LPPVEDLHQNVLYFAAKVVTWTLLAIWWFYEINGGVLALQSWTCLSAVLVGFNYFYFWLNIIMEAYCHL